MVSRLEAAHMAKKQEPTPASELRELQLRIIELENKVQSFEKKGARVRPIDLVSMSFFATVNSAIIVVSIMLIIFIRMKLL